VLNNNAARVLRYFLTIKSKFEMRKRIQSPRILKINWIDELIVSVVFNNGESRVINFSTVFDQICVNEESPAYILRDPEEFAKMELEGYTLSWENASQIIMGLDGKSRQVPFEIGPDTLYDFSQPDVTSVGLNIGYEIRRSRLASGMTQQDLANKSGTTRNYISRIENNHSDIEMGTLRKIIEIGLGRKLDIQIR
jgi:DNA-binding XRE family transcriptional regulator